MLQIRMFEIFLIDCTQPCAVVKGKQFAIRFQLV